MSAMNVGPGGLQPPGPIATRCEASQPHNPSSVAARATSPPEATWSLDTALHAKALVVTVSTPKGPVRLSGGPAKALLALAAAGERGVSPPQAIAWTAQLASPVRDLRQAGIAVHKDHHSPRSGAPTRYVLESQPDIAVTHLVPRGGVR